MSPSTILAAITDRVLPSPLLVVLSTILALAVAKAVLFRGSPKRLPPSPPALPILGHLLHFLKRPLHRSFTELSKRYGPLLYLRIGSTLVLLVGSASVAEKCLVGHDIIFANRPKISVAEIFGFNYTSIGFTSYGPHWRHLQRTVAMEILSTPRLNQLSHVRSEEVKFFARELMEAGWRGEFTTAKMRPRFGFLMLNVMMKIVMGMKAERGDPEAEHFFLNFEETTVLAGATVPGDFLPFLKLLDGPIKRRMMAAREDGNRYLARIIEERQKTVKLLTKEELEDQNMEIKCLADSLIAQKAIDPDYYTDDIVYGALSFMMTACADTSAVTSEWALSLAINHLDMFQKVREEVESYVGKGNLVAEKDLPYLQAVVLKTLRLYPALPLLIPHETSEDTVIDGYDVPACTMVFLNVPYIHRDPALWEEPNRFMPERFLNNSELMPKTGTGGRYMPFGAGRRRCPGEALGLRIVGLILATLVQCFDWEKLVGQKKHLRRL